MPHIHDKIDFTVEVFVVYKNKVLLRKHDKYGIWLGVGGHIELNEDPIEAAIREVKEEVGLDIELVGEKIDFNDENYQELLSPYFMNRHRISDTHEHITLTYIAKSKTDQIREGKTEKSDEWKWLGIEDLRTPTFEINEHIKHYALTFFEII